MTIWRPRDQIWSGLDSIIMIFFAQTELHLAPCNTLGQLWKTSLNKDSKALHCSRAASIFSLGPHLRRSFLVPAKATPSTVCESFPSQASACVEYHWKIWRKLVKPFNSNDSIIRFCFPISLIIAEKNRQITTVCENFPSHDACLNYLLHNAKSITEKY